MEQALVGVSSLTYYSLFNQHLIQGVLSIELRFLVVGHS